MSKWKYEGLVSSVNFKKTLFNKYKLISFSNDLSLVGKGRSASVFHIKNTMKVIKVFYPGFQYLSQKEAMIYKKLENMDAHPRCFDYGYGYIVLDYIEGEPLFDYLVKGKYISKDIVDTIDCYIQEIKARGLYPGDVHLKNIIVTPNDKVKLIDLVRYDLSENDHRWHDLKKAYEQFYQLRFSPKKYAKWFLFLIAYIYKKVVEC